MGLKLKLNIGDASDGPRAGTTGGPPPSARSPADLLPWRAGGAALVRSQQTGWGFAVASALLASIDFQMGQAQWAARGMAL